MRVQNVIAGLGLAAILAACQTSRSESVADYCADPNRADQNICRLHVEIGGQKTALADTNLKLSEARTLAEAASSAAISAQDTANEALRRADAATLREDQLFCQTRTLQKTNIGTCEAGYTLMSCSQTRYTYRAGGLSFLREIDDQQCRFDQRVLEMQVRCCRTAAG